MGEGEVGYFPKIPERACAAQRGRDYEFMGYKFWRRFLKRGVTSNARKLQIIKGNLNYSPEIKIYFLGN